MSGLYELSQCEETDSQGHWVLGVGSGLSQALGAVFSSRQVPGLVVGIEQLMAVSERDLRQHTTHNTTHGQWNSAATHLDPAYHVMFKPCWFYLETRDEEEQMWNRKNRKSAPKTSCNVFFIQKYNIQSLNRQTEHTKKRKIPVSTQHTLLLLV